MVNRYFSAALVTLGFGLVSSPAFAHNFGTWEAGFPQGFLHPMLGLDHVLAMAGVGFWAGQMDSRATWLIPLCFVVAMLGGGALGIAGVALPTMELGIAGSVALVGGLIALHARLPLSISVAIVGAFAVFHGVAHGSEVPEAASPVLYCFGFLVATALLNLAGVGFASFLGNQGWRRVGRAVGLGVAMLGLGLLAQG